MGKYLDRDISWLSFNRRVSDETEKKIPLQSKILFHGITHSNLNEFLMVRYPSMFEYADNDTISLFQKKVLDHYNELHGRFNKFQSKHKKDLFPTYSKLSKTEKRHVKSVFNEKIYAGLQVIGCDLSQRIYLHGGMYIFFAYRINNTDRYSYTEIPSYIPRFIPTGIGTRVVPIEDVIKSQADKLIVGATDIKVVPFAIARSAEVYLQNAKYRDPYKMIQDTLKEREKSWITYVEIRSCNSNIERTLMNILPTEERTLILRSNIINLMDLKRFPGDGFTGDDRSKKYEPIVTFPNTGIFDYIEKSDRIAYHPYESYQSSMVRFLEEAANDPKTVSIKISLYRVSDNSRIIDALLKAADKGKQVVVLIELKARFDEHHNMEISNILREGGVRIVYTKPDIKTHAKVCLVARKIDGKIKIYSQVGTGNYSESNAKQYSDYSYFSARQDLGKDLNKFFNLITSEQGTFKSDRIIYAPYNMRDELMYQIERQMKFAGKGKRARIIAKCNSLTDDKMADKLIAAANAGVKVILIVRGACVLEPQKNIKIYSIVGTFLEHSRVYLFGYGSRSVVYLGSADLMYRSFNKRFELLMKVENHKLKNRLIKHLQMYLKDNTNRRVILPNYQYRDIKHKKSKRYSCQEEFYEEAKGLAQ